MIASMTAGCIYSDVKIPLDLDMNRTPLGPKMGRASNHSVLWLVAWGDASTAAAARNGEIATIDHLDQEIEVIFFGLYVKTTTIAYGE